MRILVAMMMMFGVAASAQAHVPEECLFEINQVLGHQERVERAAVPANAYAERIKSLTDSGVPPTEVQLAHALMVSGQLVEAMGRHMLAVDDLLACTAPDFFSEPH